MPILLENLEKAGFRNILFDKLNRWEHEQRKIMTNFPPYTNVVIYKPQIVYSYQLQSQAPPVRMTVR